MEYITLSVIFSIFADISICYTNVIKRKHDLLIISLVNSNPTPTPPAPPFSKPSSVIAWLGFGFSITLFLLIWLLNILIFTASLPGRRISGIYMIMFLLGGFLGLLAMVFSISGLVMAVKNNTPKWIGASGIILCVASAISFFIPVAVASVAKTHTIKVNTPEDLTSTSHTGTKPSLKGVSDKAPKEDIRIQVFCIHRVRCINNNLQNTVIGNFNTYDPDFNLQFTNWLKLNNVDSSKAIIVDSSEEASYSDIIMIMDMLQENNITDYRLSSDLKEREYFIDDK